MTPQECGRLAAKVFLTSEQYAQFSKSTPAEVVMKLFWPPTQEDLLQVSRPLPPARQAWLNAFNEERARLLTPPVVEEGEEWRTT